MNISIYKIRLFYCFIMDPNNQAETIESLVEKVRRLELDRDRNAELLENAKKYIKKIENFNRILIRSLDEVNVTNVHGGS